MLVVVALLAGCGGGGNAAPEPASTPAQPTGGAVTMVTSTPSRPATPVTSASAQAGYPADVPLTGPNVRPGETPPVYPAAARARTQAGANAFAGFFMATLDWAYATTNPSYMKHYYASSCGLCAGLATGIAKTAAEGDFYRGGRLIVYPATKSEVAPVTAPAQFCSLVAVDTQATQVVDRHGEVLNSDRAYTGDRYKVCVLNASRTASWSVTYLARVP